ncbi:MAG: DUF4198 domain-containing protein [Planctomycetota bacterium]
MKQKLARLVRWSLLLLVAGPLAAHDFWMVPGSFRPAKDSLLNVALYVGDFGKGDEVERKEERIVKFLAATPDGEKKIVGRDGATPAGFLRTKSEGVYVLGFQSSHASVTLAPEKFQGYLTERGLDSIMKLREARGETGKEVREIYSRSPKSIVQVGDMASSGWDTPLGLTLELTPSKNPYALARETGSDAFEVLPIRLTFHGKPLAGALVGALSLDAPPRDVSDPTNVVHARTDEAGMVNLKLPRGGKWLVAAVHMLALEGNPDADYESFWGSLTFEIPAPRP